MSANSTDSCKLLVDLQTQPGILREVMEGYLSFILESNAKKWLMTIGERCL